MFVNHQLAACNCVYPGPGDRPSALIMLVLRARVKNHLLSFRSPDFVIHSPQFGIWWSNFSAPGCRKVQQKSYSERI